MFALENLPSSLFSTRYTQIRISGQNCISIHITEYMALNIATSADPCEIPYNVVPHLVQCHTLLRAIFLNV